VRRFSVWDPFPGQWKVAVSSSVVGDSLFPNSFVVGIATSESTYHITFPTPTVSIGGIHIALSDTAGFIRVLGRGDSMDVAPGRTDFRAISA